MKKEATFKWDDKEFIEFYRNSANVIMLERQRCIEILIQVLSLHFPNLTGLSILDLGCGDGEISSNIIKQSNSCNFTLLDASEEMLSKAKERLGNSSIVYTHMSFEDYFEKNSEDSKYDIVVSANAIHHLDYIGKSEIFTQIYKELKLGGAFVNIDPVEPPSSYSEKIQFGIWKNSMNETIKKTGRNEEVGKYDHIPSKYKNNLENKPSGLWDQLKALEQSGFRDVDCFYKYSIFVVYGGFKF
ncbi:class I SAM-dependent methyltransferase [uncultured Desulfobacter sp.]|uniref:class I SAM-dependent methyltransferase n=1 Tax=uncultured Desulfobacter sp. TaxID=240139 RepID=UPI002AAB1C51|nr:class I SAM-dependent methyltransferase [uncultured Desulfobacter sp.]